MAAEAVEDTGAGAAARTAVSAVLMVFPGADSAAIPGTGSGFMARVTAGMAVVGTAAAGAGVVMAGAEMVGAGADTPIAIMQAGADIPGGAGAGTGTRAGDGTAATTIRLTIQTTATILPTLSSTPRTPIYRPAVLRQPMPRRMRSSGYSRK